MTRFKKIGPSSSSKPIGFHLYQNLLIGVLIFSILLLGLQGSLLVLFQSVEDKSVLNIICISLASLLSLILLIVTSNVMKRQQPGLYPSWLMLTISMGCNPLAGILAGIIPWVAAGVDPLVIVNFFVLIVYPLYLLMVALFPSRTTRKLELIQWIFDSLIIASSLSLIYWDLILAPTISVGNGNLDHLVYSIASQIGDLLIIWAIVMLLFRPLKDQRSLPLWWLLAGFSLLLIYDLITAATSTTFNATNYTTLKETLLTGSILFLGIAGIQQVNNLSKTINWSKTKTSDTWWTTFRLISPYLSLGFSFFFLISAIYHKQDDSLLLSYWVAGILLLVIARQVLVLMENQRLSNQLAELNRDLEHRVVERTEELSLVNKELQKRESLMEHNALHDSLTDLPNRALLIDRIKQSIIKMRRDPKYSFGVLFMDLDGFKVINDSMGHLAGDQLLIHFAERLKGTMREVDTIARLGGDEFVILLDGCISSNCMSEAAKRVLKLFDVPFSIDSQTTYLNASIGIVPGNTNYTDPIDLLRDADLAMYEAKTLGKAQFILFSDELKSTALTRLLMERDLRHALENEQLFLVYQPIITLSNQEISGFEALIRWQHPALGLISPGNFISTAESNGMITPISYWVFEKAIAQLSIWKEQFSDLSITISVNLSARLFNHPELTSNIQNLLSKYNLSPESLILEITESSIIQNSLSAATTLQTCRNLGIQIQMDDFGTGYSSLSYLHSFPLNAIKIAQDFVLGLEPGSKKSEIIQTIVNLAKELNLEVIAEGIETHEQMNLICKSGCQSGQGYYISRPLSTDAADQYLIDQQKKKSYRAEQKHRSIFPPYDKNLSKNK